MLHRDAFNRTRVDCLFVFYFTRAFGEPASRRLWAHEMYPQELREHEQHGYEPAWHGVQHEPRDVSRRRYLLVVQPFGIPFVFWFTEKFGSASRPA
jgi:hypothetical protein